MTEAAQENIDEIKGEEALPETPPEIAPEIIERAKLMGHIPKEEFKGDPDKWVPADKYVERADNLMPILRSQLGKYETEITSLKSTVESQKKTTEKLLKMSEKIGVQAYEKAKRDLTIKQAAAVKEGDVEQWQQLEDQKDKLEKPEPIQAEPIPVEDPIFASWKTDNNWYATDGDMAMFADSYGMRLKTENPTMTYEQILSAATNKVKEAFPHKFTNPKRDETSPVDSSTQTNAQTKTDGKTYNDLPADAKAQCNVWIKDGTIKSKEQYVKDYFEED